MQTCFSWLKIYVLFHSPSTVSVLCRREMEPQEKWRKVNIKKTYWILLAFPVTYWSSRSGESIFVRFLQLAGQLYCVRRAICPISPVTHTCYKSNFAKSWLHSILSDNRIHEHVESVEGPLTDCAIYPSRKTSGLPVSPAQSPLLSSKSWNNARILKMELPADNWKPTNRRTWCVWQTPSSQPSFEIPPTWIPLIKPGGGGV